MKEWSTACPDWEERILGRRSLIPFDPLFPAEADAALDIFRSLKIVDAAGSPTMGEVCRQWVLDFVASIFGSYDAETGRRLIQYFFLLISKKNSKSTTAAGIMITALLRNWRMSGEFYILAPTKEIADNSYNPARDMVQADPALNSILKPSAGRVIEHRNTGAFLKVVAADSETVSGKKTIGLLIDELWLFGKRANAANLLLEAMGGLASRPEGFVIYLSTQSDAPPLGVFSQKLEEFRNIRDGKIIVPGSLPVLYEFPKSLLKDEQFRKRENWYVTNPNLGASVDERYLEDKHAEAERAGRAEVVGWFAKHLNVQIGNNLRSDGWAGAMVWPRGVETGLTLDEILRRSEVVTIGLDGGGLDDLLGVAVIGREAGTNRWLGWAHGLISTLGVYRRKANAEDYLRFKKAGELTVFRFGHPDETSIDDDPILADLLSDVPEADTSPNVLPPDIQFVVDLVSRVSDAGLLAQVGVDAAGIGAIVDALAGIGVTQDAETLDAVRQGIALMGSIKTIERKLADGSFRHGAQLLLGWCIGNLRIVPTPTAMRVGRDEAGFGKVDPAMALFNAGHLMSMNPEATDVFPDDYEMPFIG
ncbi:terminase large subunit [Mesorhizobium sp. M0915]|uniref:terminase large subunit n=1 Tax=Mesorhizobium sp. M0915 TaxID=2957027 RepID=UPI00333572F0